MFRKFNRNALIAAWEAGGDKTNDDLTISRGRWLHHKKKNMIMRKRKFWSKDGEFGFKKHFLKCHYVSDL